MTKKQKFTLFLFELLGSILDTLGRFFETLYERLDWIQENWRQALGIALTAFAAGAAFGLWAVRFFK